MKAPKHYKLHVVGSGGIPFQEVKIRCYEIASNAIYVQAKTILDSLLQSYL